MNSNYKNWLETEKRWIGEYKKVILRKDFYHKIPTIVLIMALLFGMLGLLGGEKDALMGIFGGLVTAIFISVFYLLYLMVTLRSGKYMSMIKEAVSMLDMGEEEKNQLGQEMMEAEASEWRKVSFVMSGPGSNDTPARFKVTPNYAFLEGGAPYAILVRLSDVVKVEPGKEVKTTVVREGKTKRNHSFTLYTIGFHHNSDQEAKKLPDQAMGFFSREIRDKVLDLLKKNGKHTELR